MLWFPLPIGMYPFRDGLETGIDGSGSIMFPLPIGMYPFQDSIPEEAIESSVKFPLPIGMYPFRDEFSETRERIFNASSHCLSACIPFETMDTEFFVYDKYKSSHCLSACIPFETCACNVGFTYLYLVPIAYRHVSLSGHSLRATKELSLRGFHCLSAFIPLGT